MTNLTFLLDQSVRLVLLVKSYKSYNSFIRTLNRMVHVDGRGTYAVGTGRMKVTMRGSFWLGLTDEDVGVSRG